MSDAQAILILQYYQCCLLGELTLVVYHLKGKTMDTQAVKILQLQQGRLLAELSLVERLLKKLVEGKPLTDTEAIDLRYFIAKW